jgi:hypothetical protein
VDDEEEESKDPVSPVPVYHLFICPIYIFVELSMPTVVVDQLTIRMQVEKQPFRNCSQRYTKMQVTIPEGQ